MAEYNVGMANISVVCIELIQVMGPCSLPCTIHLKMMLLQASYNLLVSLVVSNTFLV